MSEILGLRNHDVTVDGSSLSLTFDGRWGEQITVSMPADHLEALMASLGRVKQEVSIRQQPQKLVFSFRGLQSWSASRIPGQEYVFVILDGSTALAAPYAIPPETAEELAAALLSAANAVRKQRRDN